MSKNTSRTIKGISGEYLSPNEVLFIDEYMSSGMQNAWQCYMKIFPDCSEASAKTCSYKLLKRKIVKGEIEARFSASKATTAWVLQQSMDYVDNGKKDFKASSAGQKALEMIAKHKHMLDSEVKVQFGGGVPVIISYASDEEKANFLRKRQGGGRIQE